MNAHPSGVAHLVAPVAKKNQFASANGVKVGVRNGSAVTMCSVFMPIWSTCATMMLFSTAPRVGVEPAQLAHLPLQVANDRVRLVAEGLSAGAVDVHRRRV